MKNKNKHDNEEESIDSKIAEEELEQREATDLKAEKQARKKQRQQAREALRDPKAWREALRKKVRIFYDLQRLRIQTAGRGLPKGKPTEKANIQPVMLSEIDIEILDGRAKELKTAERNAFNDIEDHLYTSAFYQKVLSDKERWKGLGPTIASVILSEFDITRLETVSQMWSFAGLAPVPARRCKECQTLVEERDGEFEHSQTLVKIKCSRKGKTLSEGETFPSASRMHPTKGKKLPYNAFLKMKLVGVLGSCLLKSGSPWRKFYDNYRHRKESAGWGISDGHRHNAAIRYMVKMLLLEIWKEWRAHEGLSVRPPYQEEYLGHVHHAA